MIQIHDFSHTISDAKARQAEQALQAVLARQDLGFHQVPSRTQLWIDVQKQAEILRSQADTLVVVGIGGSSLGPRALYEIFECESHQKKIFFSDNVDGIEFSKLWKKIKNLDSTAWLFVSKSGSTIEALVTADLVFQEYQKQQKKLNAVVISEKKSNPLMDWAATQKFPTLEIPQDVGGRYSVLTAVGMLPMGFLGLKVDEFRQGAQAALLDPKIISQVMAQFAQSFERQEWISFFWFYSGMYQNFGRWLQQLWAESLAKTQSRKNTLAKRVSTPMWAIGSSDQHSLLQQVMDGAKDKFVVFSRFQSVENAGSPMPATQFPVQSFFNGHSLGQLIKAQAQGTRQALNEQQVSTMTLEIKDLSEASLGYQMMFWQLVVAGLGEMLDLNAFDQPGVELGKRLAKQILKS